MMNGIATVHAAEEKRMGAPDKRALKGKERP
jgi:hypothetical protein